MNIPKRLSTCISSGNTKVYVDKYNDGDGKYYYEITVAKDYASTDTYMFE